MNILEKLKLVEEHFKNISVKKFEKNLEDLEVEKYVDLKNKYKIKESNNDKLSKIY